MSEFKVDETKFDEWWEENYMNVSADRSEAFDIYLLGIKHQQAKVEELQKRVDAALGHLDDVNFPPDYEDAWESFYNAEQALKEEG